MTRDSIRALVDAATEGPWVVGSMGDSVRAPATQEGIGDYMVTADAAFIAASRTAVPLLLVVADAAAPFLRFVADMREHGKTNVVVDIEAIADALAALEAQK